MESATGNEMRQIIKSLIVTTLVNFFFPASLIMKILNIPWEDNAIYDRQIICGV